MTEPTYIVLYVDNAAQSAELSANLLDLKPVESSPAFALFVLKSGVKLGLWSKHDVQPAATQSGGAELCFSLADKETVNAWHKTWIKRGMSIIQTPTDTDFGFTFVATDPDGHRLRVFARSET